MKTKTLEFKKLSKRKQKEINKKQRVVVEFNTGPRIHQSPRHPTRAQLKQQKYDN